MSENIGTVILAVAVLNSGELFSGTATLIAWTEVRNTTYSN
jgi:hypothetical protein